MLTILLLPLLAQLAAPSITLTVDGKEVVIRHICAMEALDFDDKPVINVLMTAKAPVEAGDRAAVERQLRRESRNPDGPVAGMSAVLGRGTAGALEWTEGMLFLPGRPSPYISS